MADMDVTFSALAVEGFGGSPVPNQFLRQRADATTLGVLLPGQDYTCDMPLLYYGERLLDDRGADVLSVRYDYRSLRGDVNREEREGRLRDDVGAALETGLSQRRYDRLVLVGKSLGTRAMAHMVENTMPAATWRVWLTPPLRDPDVLECISRHGNRSHVVIGTGDGHYDPVVVENLRIAHGCRVTVIAGAEHSLDVEGNVAASVEALRTVMSDMTMFLGYGT
jgi:hypothetical protein